MSFWEPPVTFRLYILNWINQLKLNRKLRWITTLTEIGTRSVLKIWYHVENWPNHFGMRNEKLMAPNFILRYIWDSCIQVHLIQISDIFSQESLKFHVLLYDYYASLWNFIWKKAFRITCGADSMFSGIYKRTHNATK